MFGRTYIEKNKDKDLYQKLYRISFKHSIVVKMSIKKTLR